MCWYIVSLLDKEAHVVRVIEAMSEEHQLWVGVYCYFPISKVRDAIMVGVWLILRLICYVACYFWAWMPAWSSRISFVAFMNDHVWRSAVCITLNAASPAHANRTWRSVQAWRWFYTSEIAIKLFMLSIVCFSDWGKVKNSKSQSLYYLRQLQSWTAF